MGGVLQGAYQNMSTAVIAGASFIIDVPADRARHYNVGEREIAAYLISKGYRETTPGRFARSA